MLPGLLDEVASFDIAERRKPGSESRRSRCPAACEEPSDAAQPRRLLGARHQRPCDRRAANQRKKVAPLHSITSSARGRFQPGSLPLHLYLIPAKSPPVSPGEGRDPPCRGY